MAKQNENARGNPDLQPGTLGRRSADKRFQGSGAAMSSYHPGAGVKRVAARAKRKTVPTPDHIGLDHERHNA